MLSTIDIRVETIKRMSANINLKPNMNFSQVMQKANVSLKYITNDNTTYVFKATSKINPNIQFMVKIFFYLSGDNGNNGAISPDHIGANTNIEIAMINLLGRLVRNKKTPHFMLPIGSFNSNTISFIDAQSRRYIDEKKFKNTMDVMMCEYSDTTLLDYILVNKLSLNSWTALIFQFLFTLATVHNKFALFRHNSMSPNNILIKYINSSDGNYMYILNNSYSFQIPNIGIQLRIWNFDLASVNGNNRVDDIWKTDLNISTEPNRYYDMYYFFHMITNQTLFPQSYLPIEIIEFVHRIIPKKYTINNSNIYNLLAKNAIDGKRRQQFRRGGDIVIDSEYTTPYEVITTDKLFDKYRRPSNLVHRTKADF